MRRYHIITIAVLVLQVFSLYKLKCQPAKLKREDTSNLAVIFLHPPESAKPGVLWMWMGSNISKEGITRDLEELKKEGLNRTTMFSLADVTTPWAGEIKKSPTPQIVAWTEPWWHLVRFAAEESKRLGMDFGMFNGAGYEASGGIWITPELSMKELCYSGDTISGGKPIYIKLKKPVVPLRGHTPYPLYNPQTDSVEIPEIAARKTFYKDVAVLALPAAGIVAKDSVMNVTSLINSNGELNWNAPKGNWIIYRFGYTTSGTLIQPAQWAATGLECDKMSQVAVDFHINHVISEIQKHLGDLIGTGFTHVHFDSYEAGTPTWTEKMAQEFLARRGYDLTPWLPIFCGRTIGSHTDSLAFENDFDATIKDLYRDVYFTTLSKKLNAAHLNFLCEPYGGPWRQDEIMPLVKNVMTEFWTNGGEYSPYELKETVAALRKSGKNIIEAEAFTGDPKDSKWSETPSWLKPIGDAAFCDGVNRFVLHRFVQQPWSDKYKPGAAMGQWGTHFDRTQTWWKPAAAMIQYWQRCQALLQWGTIVLQNEDFTATDRKDSINLKYIHRRDGNTDVYFVANTARMSGSVNCSFYVNGRQPELWDPVTGNMRKLPEYEMKEGKTFLPLTLEAAQSYFIVFRHKETEVIRSKNKNFYSLQTIAKINGSWKVQFDSLWGGPAKPVSFKTLDDWTLRSETGIKYFSGTAIYHTTFDAAGASFSNQQSATYLDLGIVKHIAHVFLNDEDLGIVWTAPWRIKLPPGLLKKKNNTLQIEITNVWANRLIGDEQEPPDCEWSPGFMGGYFLKAFPNWFLNHQPRPSKKRYCFTTWNYFTKNSPLISSGLLGPVQLMKEED